jgi:Questin oxidase-like
LLEKGAAAALEEYIFSPKANFDSAREGKAQPEMLNRFVSSILHPMIHTGFGVEFGLYGIVAEGQEQQEIRTFILMFYTQV